MTLHYSKDLRALGTNTNVLGVSTAADEPSTSDNAPTEKQVSAQMSTRETENENQYPSGLSLALILTSCFICMFLTSLLMPAQDRLIITTAIPSISDEFKSVTDIAWYGSAYLLTQCASQLLFGKIYSFFSIKGTFLTSLLLFEVGSAICGAAPSSIAFIVGRAVSGLGAAGILSGIIIIIVHAIPLHKRPLYQGMFGAVFGASSVTGPLLGGAFTSKVSWRWCFFINLPLGCVAAVVIFVILKIPNSETEKLSIKAKLAQLDFYGTGLLVPGSVSLILALQWGGSILAWNDKRIIALLVVAGSLFFGFVLVQTFRPKTATVPPRIFNQRSILAGFFSTICVSSQMTIFAYYLPIWFQAIQGVSAVESGIRLLPLVLSMVVAMLSAGVLVRRIGYYTPVMIFGVCLMAIGAGLMYTLQVNTGSRQWIGYQIIYGLGAGSATQAPNIAAQTVLPKRDVPIGVSLMYFGNFMSSAILLPVAQNILNTQLLRRLSSIPGVDSETILDNGVTSLTDLPDSVRVTVLFAYNEAIRHVFLVALVLVCLAMLGALSLEWRSTKKTDGKETSD
ncbi:MFS aflatoxin efflux pump [Colletotrichum tofieldiae]|nr:MFS aflatoxin efflux pump [Colletotrichum tofieldiae]